VVLNNLNPEWVKSFRILYVFEKRQRLRFRVFDVDNESGTLNDQDFLGEVEVDLCHILAHPGATELELRARGVSESCGTFVIVAEEVRDSASVVQLAIEGIELPRSGFFCRGDPFFVIAKCSESGRWLPVFQSEDKSTMHWGRCTIPVQILCNADYDWPLRISFFDRRSCSAPASTGYIDATFARLGEMAGQVLPVVTGRETIGGSVRLSEFRIEQRQTFSDYLRAGFRLNLITCIDFTSSNLSPNDPWSLHFMGGQTMNQYERCIRDVGEIICPYDSDQMFLVWGFGARVGGVVNHCFSLTFSESAPCVRGLEGIVEAYRHSLTQLTLAGPTFFAPCIRAATDVSRQAFQADRTYTILLIMTDGIINDMGDTVDALVDAGDAPLSVIIVGIGEADFTNMNVLDADDAPLVSTTGRRMTRDLVQFVPYRTVEKSGFLAAEVLAEVPTQFVTWASQHQIRPG
jgi:hypothetical protein